MQKDVNRPGRPITMPAPWGDLFKCIGGQQKLAEKLGVSKSTVGKWATSVHRIPQLAKKELVRLCEEHGIKAGVDNLRGY